MSERHNDYIWHYDAEGLALKRAERVLQLHLPSLLAERDDIDPGVGVEDGKIFRAPPASNYYRAKEQLETMLRGAGIGVQITAEPTTAQRGIRHSRNPNEGGELVTWTLRVGLAFIAPTEYWSGLLDLQTGRKETQLEATERIARAYKGCLMSILLEQLPGGDGIVHAKYQLSRGQPHQIDNMNLTGLAVAKVQITQAVRIENPKHEVAP